MALTKISTDGVKDNAIKTEKILNSTITAADLGNDCVGTAELQNSAVETVNIQDQAVALSKLPHGTSSNDGKFLRANNGADPSFETVTSTTINNNADNRVITGSGTANTLEAESNLTFNGNQLAVTGTTTVVGQFNGATIPTIEVSQTTNNTDLQLRANSTGGLVRTASNTPLVFGTNQQERMRIDSSGNVGINTTSASHKLHVESAASGVIAAKQTTNNGGFNTFEGKSSGGSVTFYASHNGRVGASEGIIFGSDTATDNVLDGYEEGTFTATITGIGGGTNPTFAAQTSSAAYIRVGRIVHCHVYIFDINCTNSGTGIVTTIAGFPFASSGHYYPGVVTHNTIIGNGNVNTGYLQANSNSPHFIPLIDGTTGGNNANTGNPKYIMVSVSYTAQ